MKFKTVLILRILKASTFITVVIYSMRFIRVLFERGLKALLNRWTFELAFFGVIFALIFLGLLAAVYFDHKMSTRE